MPSLVERCWDLINGQTQCVLATQGQAGPHCSLMSFLADRKQGSLYLVTSRQTRKFANIAAHARVSLLVDDRSGGQNGRAGRALTITGDCAVLEPGPELEQLIGRFRAAHPALAPILDAPQCAVLAVNLISFQLLDGVARAEYTEL